MKIAYDKPDALHSCSHFVWHVIQAYLPNQPYLDANLLLKHLDGNSAWEEIARTESAKMAELAKKGTLIVGGRVDSPNGHVIVVFPGDVAQSGGYQYTYKGKAETVRSHGVFARCMSRSLSSWPGAVSNGDKTIWDPWAGPKFNQTRFWILKSTK